MKRFNIKKFNRILELNSQTIRALEITGKIIKLSSGITITDIRAVGICKRRVMQGHPVWAENFDNLYNADIKIREKSEKLCRAETSRQGGINVQNKHGEKIKLNLNTGEPWNKGKPGLQIAWNKNLTKDNHLSLKRLSESRLGEGNPMFGKHHSAEAKKILSKSMKAKILSGEFTPNSNNRNTHWDSEYDNKKYRSSWEALYQYHNPSDEYETLRIPYLFNNEEHVYIVDFVNYQTKHVTEVKPKELCNDSKTVAKITALKEWCVNCNFHFILADKVYLLTLQKPSNMLLFDNKTKEKINKLYETN